MGEQPGRATSGYLTEWKALPEKTFFPTNGDWSIRRLSATNFPFPFSRSANKPNLPYIAFDHEGRPAEIVDLQTGRSALRFEDITNSVARGAVFYARDNQGQITSMEIQEIPLGNGAYTLFVVDGVTGRAKREELGVQ